MTRYLVLLASNAAVVVMLICGAASAQDFVVEGGRRGPPPQYEWRPPVLIRVGETSSELVRQPMWAGEVRVLASRYGLYSAFNYVTRSERLYYTDLRTGAEGWVPDVVLEGTVEQSGYYNSPRMVADDLHPRVFIWHRHRVSVLDCETLQVRDLLTADPPYWTGPDGTRFEWPRDLTFAPESNLLFLRRTNPDDGSFETAVVDGTTGALVRRIPIIALRMSVNRAGTRLLLATYPFELHLVSVSTGVTLSSPYPRDFDPDPFSEDLPGPPVLDEIRSRIIVPVQGGFYALDHQLAAIASVHLPWVGVYPALTTSAWVSRATGRTLLRWAGGRRSGYPLPGPCHQAVLRPDDSLARVEDLSTLGATELQGCGSAGFNVPAPPTGLEATVAGRRATLTWRNPGDVAGFEIEIGTAPGRTDLRVPVGPVTSASWDDVPAGTYFVRVRGANEFGPGPSSDTLAVVVR